MATSEAPRLAATAEALPPPGTGAAEPSSSTNPPRVRSRKLVPGDGSTPRLYGCGLGSGAAEPGRARYRRARPETHDSGGLGEGLPPGAGALVTPRFRSAD